jgi:hypothetical protein
MIHQDLTSYKTKLKICLSAVFQYIWFIDETSFKYTFAIQLSVLVLQKNLLST